jgi:hypothetical protein
MQEMTFEIHVHIFRSGADGSTVHSFYTPQLSTFAMQLASSIDFHRAMVDAGNATEVHIVTSMKMGEKQIDHREHHIEFVRGQVSTTEFNVGNWDSAVCQALELLN